MTRPDGRAADQLRPIHFIPHIVPTAAGSVLCCFGSTRVICTVTVEEGVPRWMKEQNVPGGWLTAEYAMLPASTGERKARDISKGKLDGRSSEIQRLIGRAMRAVIDLKMIGQRTLWVDCDVLQADGGTRTASITGACVAAALAFDRLAAERKIARSPMKHLVGAVSAGIFKGEALLDLNYIEDKDAEVDANFVMTEAGDFVEIQGTGEESTFSAAQLSQLLALGEKGIRELCCLQHAAINATREKPTGDELKSLGDFFTKKR